MQAQRLCLLLALGFVEAVVVQVSASDVATFLSDASRPEGESNEQNDAGWDVEEIRRRQKAA